MALADRETGYLGGSGYLHSEVLSVLQRDCFGDMF